MDFAAPFSQLQPCLGLRFLSLNQFDRRVACLATVAFSFLLLQVRNITLWGMLAVHM